MSTEEFSVELEDGSTVTYHEWREIDTVDQCHHVDPHGQCSDTADWQVQLSYEGGDKKWVRFCQDHFTPPQNGGISGRSDDA